MVKRPPLLIVLGVIGVILAVTPLVTLTFLRVPESELVRRTESELIAQGAMLAAMYSAALSHDEPLSTERTLTPMAPILDLSEDQVLPLAGKPPETDLKATPAAQEAGRAITPVLVEAQRTTLAGMRVTDPVGIIVASTADDEVGRLLTHQQEVVSALHGKPQRLIRRRYSDNVASVRSPSRGTEHRVFVALPILRNGGVIGAVSLSRTPISLGKATFQHRKNLTLAAAVVMAVGLLLIALVVWIVARPLARLAEQARRIGAGADATPIRRPGTQEVAVISEAMAEMAIALTERGRYLETFASNVSHAFKTPLTSVKGALELLADHDDMTRAERERFLTIARADTERMERLTQRLLALARADVADRGGTCDVDALLARLADRYRADGMTIEVTGPFGIGGLPGEALESVFCTLLDNAREHAGADSAVHISALPGAALTVTVADDGPGIPDELRDRIFDPFFTTAGDRGGTGLGLAVASSMMRSHGGSLSLAPGAPSFRLLMPRA